MSNQEVFDKVAQLIANRFSVDVETVTEGMTFQQDLGADSLDVVELVMELEDEFGVQISDEDAENITTIGDAVNYIASHQEENGKAGSKKTSSFFCRSLRNVDRMGMLRNKKNRLSFEYRQMSCNVLET